MKHNVGVILEKPTVVNLSELTRLNKSIKKYGANFYNILHFSFGKEVLWFKSNLSNFGLPNKIKVFISDKYVENQKIKECAINLSGAYLDETINPISAIANIFGYNITSNNLTKQKYKKRFDDHYCTSTFILNNDIEISVEVDWSKNINDKYIDLFYSNKVIRLDSMNRSVIDLNLNKVLFRCDGERMTNHYKGGFQNFLCEPNNISKSMKLHKEILKLVWKQKSYLFQAFHLVEKQQYLDLLHKK